MAELLWDSNREVPTAEDVSMSAMAHESFSFEYFVFNIRPIGRLNESLVRRIESWRRERQDSMRRPMSEASPSLGSTLTTMPATF